MARKMRTKGKIISSSGTPLTSISNQVVRKNMNQKVKNSTHSSISLCSPSSPSSTDGSGPNWRSDIDELSQLAGCLNWEPEVQRHYKEGANDRKLQYTITWQREKIKDLEKEYDKLQDRYEKVKKAELEVQRLKAHILTLESKLSNKTPIRSSGKIPRKRNK